MYKLNWKMGWTKYLLSLSWSSSNTRNFFSAPREVAQRAHESQEGEVDPGNAGRRMQKGGRPVAGPWIYFRYIGDIQEIYWVVLKKLTLARGGSRMLIASSMASTIESGLDERDNSSSITLSASSSSSSRILDSVSSADGSDGGPVSTSLGPGSGSGTDSSSMSLRREGLAAWKVKNGSNMKQKANSFCKQCKYCQIVFVNIC